MGLCFDSPHCELRAPEDPSVSPGCPGPGRGCQAAGPSVPVSCGWHCHGQGGHPPSQCLGSRMAHLRGLHPPTPRECLFISVSMAVPWEPGLLLLGCNFPFCSLLSCCPAASTVPLRGWDALEPQKMGRCGKSTQSCLGLPCLPFPGYTMPWNCSPVLPATPTQ